MALLNGLIDFDPIIDALWVKIEPKFDQFMKNVLALLPAIGAAAGAYVVNHFPELIKGFLEKDPDIPIVSDIFDASEWIRNQINNDHRIPVQLPGLDILGGLLKGLDGK